MSSDEISREESGSQSAWDRNATTDLLTPRWSETRWHCCLCPAAGVGVYIHTGRFRSDLDMWWAHVAAYLPDGVLAVDRLWFRNSSRAGIVSDNLEIAITRNGWRSTFDGVCELSSTAGLSRHPRGCAAPSVGLRWDVTATAAAPVWDINACTRRAEDSASSSQLHQAVAAHVQRAATTVGTLRVDGQEFSLEGVGFNDHSSGPRSFSAWNGHRFMVAVMPDWVVHAFVVLHDDNTAADPIGVVVADGHTRPVTHFDAPPLSDAAGMPTDQTLFIDGPDGPITLRAEMIHALPISITEDNDNYNGVDWEANTNPMVMVEGLVRLTEPGGGVGFGFLERSARQSALPRPSGVPA